jgi:uridine kinase
MTMLDLTSTIQAIKQHRVSLPKDVAALIGISGIDGSGKGYITKQIAEQLSRVLGGIAVVNVDSWVTLPSKRFHRTRPAVHFYEHGLRMDEMWQETILPLRRKRQLDVTINACDATNAERYFPLRFHFRDIDVILLEGIFLFKRAYQRLFDCKIWIDCSFETALRRALARNSEGLSENEIHRDYETIYYPAQRIHFERDNPRQSAGIILLNDTDQRIISDVRVPRFASV